MSAVLLPAAVTNKMRTVIVFLLMHQFPIDDIVKLLESTYRGRDKIVWGGNSVSNHYYISVGHERIWEGMIP